MAEVSYDIGDYRVGWICAVNTEYVVACAMLDSEHSTPDLPTDDHNAYTCGKIGNHLVVIACLPVGKYGLTSATSVAKDMQRSFPAIDIRLMVGIGGGAPTADHDIRLGDIVVSIPTGSYGGVVHYDFGKTIQNQPLKRTGSLNSPPAKLLNAVQHLRMLHERHGHTLETIVNEMLDANPRLRDKYRKPSGATDVLFRSSCLHGNIKDDCGLVCMSRENITVHRPGREGTDSVLIVHYGLIASADKLIKDAELRDSLANSEGVLCFEMEAAGLMDWFGCLIIRGICDYSDTHKNDTWQGYAAATAAAYAKNLLQSMRAAAKSQTPNAMSKTVMMPTMLMNEVGLQRSSQHFAKRKRSGDQQTLHGKIRDSFQFRAMNDRESGVRDAEVGTFSWILNGYSQDQWDKLSRSEQRSRYQEDPAGLLDWLENGSGVFRIIGKAGSGKSTLMKLLTSSEVSARAIKKWSAPSKVIMLRYFAWKAGVAPQRSLAGLLRTALHQAFEQKPDLIDVILEEHERDFVTYHSHPHDSPQIEQWSSLDIQRFWSRLLNLTNVKLCIFLDGLDEFNESMLNMAKFISNLLEASESSVKWVIAGRYEPHFDEVIASKHFRLHEWTRPDIRFFAEKALRKHHIVKQRALAEPEGFDKLVEAVVTRAEGVFIWVMPALDSLLAGMIEADTTEKLLERLDETPVELNDLYSSILKCMPLTKLQEAAAFFSLLHEMLSPPFYTESLRTFTIAYGYEKDDPMWLKSAVSQKWTSIEEKVDQLSRRVSARCSHFICLGGQSDRHPTIQYIHRSAYEFLNSAGARQIFGGTSFDVFQWKQAVCSSEIVVQMLLRSRVEDKSWAYLFLETLTNIHTFSESGEALPSFPCPIEDSVKQQFLEAVSSWVGDHVTDHNSIERSSLSQTLDWTIEHVRHQMENLNQHKDDVICFTILALVGFDVVIQETLFFEYSPLEKLNLLTSVMIGHLQVAQLHSDIKKMLATFLEGDKDCNQYVVGGLWQRASTLLKWISSTRRLPGQFHDNQKDHLHLNGWALLLLKWMLALVEANVDVNQICVWDDRQGVGFSMSALEVVLASRVKSDRRQAPTLQESYRIAELVSVRDQLIEEMSNRGARAFVCFDKAEQAKIPADWMFPYVLNRAWCCSLCSINSPRV